MQKRPGIPNEMVALPRTQKIISQCHAGREPICPFDSSGFSPTRYPALVVRGTLAVQCFAHLPPAGVDDAKACFIPQLPTHFAVEDICGIALPQKDPVWQGQSQVRLNSSSTLRDIDNQTLKRGGAIGKN
jgi:hypothetical protein